MTGKKLNTFKTRIFLVALASMTLSVASCNPSTPAGPKLDSIAVKEGSVATEFFVGDQFSVEGGTLIARYSNNKTEEVAMTLDMVQNVPNMANEHLNYTVNVLYEKKEANYVINVRNPSITDISVKAGTSLKTQYFVGDEFSVEGGALIVRYNNNKTEEVALTLAMVKNAPDMSAEHLNYEVKVEYEGVQTSFTINVVNPSVDSISIKDGTSLKTSYFVGDEFTVEGGKLVVRYNNNKSEEIDMTLAMIQNAPDMSTAHADYEVIVQYEQKQARYTINVVEPSITGIEVKENTTLKVSYVTRETFSVDGGVLVVSYNNNKTSEVDMTLAMIKNAPDMSVPHKDYEVEVEYEGFTTSYIINVEQAVYHLVLNAENGVEDENYIIKDANNTTTANKAYNYKKVVDGVTINHFLAKANEEGYAKLAPTGVIYNYSSSGSAIKGIQAITVNFTGGDLYYQVSRDLTGKIFTEKAALTSGTAANLSTLAPSYFILQAGDAEVTIESIDVAYFDIERNFLNISQLGKEYTGIASETTYKLSINGDQVVLETLDKEQNDSFTGSIAASEGQVKIDLTGIGSVYFDVNESRSELTVDGSKGLGIIFAGLKLNEVFKVDDFEDYAATGKGYDDVGKSFSDMSGLRGAYLADFYNTEASRTDSVVKGWKLMGSSDYLTLAQGSGRNASNAAILKTSNTAGLRYYQYQSLYNVPKTLGKGATFSFWAHGPIAGLTNPSPASKDATIKVRIFYKNPIQNIDDSNGYAETKTIAKGSDWTEYTVALDANKEFYGYCIYCNTASGYTPIDDVTVYTASPYAHYEAPTPPAPEHNYKSFTGQGTVTFISQVQSVLGESTYFNFGISKDGTGKGYVLGQIFEATSYEIDKETRVLTVEGSMSVTVGGQNITITGMSGTFNTDYDVLNNVSFEGTVASYITNNGAFAIKASALSEVSDFTGSTTNGLKSIYKRWYMSGKWTADPDNWDAIESYGDDDYNGVEGGASMKIRGFAGEFSLTFKEDFDPAKSYHGMGYWVKCTTGKAFNAVKYFTYSSTGLSGAAQMYGNDVAIAENAGWTLIVCDFAQSMALKSTYNIRFYFKMSGGGQTNYVLIDNVFFY